MPSASMFLLFFLYLAFFDAPAAAQKLQIPGTCPEGSTFDPNGLECITCGENEEASGGRCNCKSGTYRNKTGPPEDGLDFGQCKYCEREGYVSSSIGDYCVRCSSTSGIQKLTGANDTEVVSVLWMPSIKQGAECMCVDGEGMNSTIAEYAPSGALFEEDGEFVKRCIICQPGTYPENGRCTSCPYPKVLTETGQCICSSVAPANEAVCVNDGEEIAYVADRLGLSAQGADQASFKLGVDVSRSVWPSVPLVRLLPHAALKCLNTGNRQSCNALANLCSLEVYQRDSFACLTYKAIVSQRSSRPYNHKTLLFGIDWVYTMPWLFYSDPPKLWTEATDLDLKLTLGRDGETASSKLELVLVVNSLDGSWHGFQDLNDQFQLCGASRRDSLSWARVGHNFNNNCKVPLKDIMRMKDALAPLFYDVYLKVGDEAFFPVPVLVLGPGESEDETMDLPSTELIRRIFLVDGISGKEENEVNPSILRYAEDISLTIQLREDGLIYPPRLTVRYASVSLTTASSLDKSVSLAFRVEYKSARKKLKNFWLFWRILLILSLGVAGLLWLVAMYQFVGSRRIDSLEPILLTFGLVKAAELSSWALSVLLTVASVLFWLTTFKFQREVMLFMISDEEITSLKIVMILAVVGQGIGVAYTIWQQVHADVFFIDWEKPRRVLSDKGCYQESAPVSCWRSLFVANEWNELQTARKTCPELTLLSMVFLLEGLRLKEAAKINPDPSDLDENPFAEDSLMLRFGMDLSLFALVGLAQIIAHTLCIYVTAGNPMLQFIDLLFLANISCAILDEKYSGYYLHGRNQSPFSDTNLKALNTNLLAEEKGLVANRGLVPNGAAGDSQDLKETQTFILYVTKAFRERYDRTMLVEHEAATQQQREQQGYMKALFKSPSRKTSSEMNAGGQVAKDFKKMIIDVENNHAEQVILSTFLFRILRTPPETSSQKTILVHDHSNSFSSVLFYGQEMRLFVFEMFLFCTLHAGLKSTGLATILAYLLVSLIRFIRAKWGEANLAAKTLVDQHFLI